MLEEIKEKNLTEESFRKGEILLQGLNKLKEKYKENISYIFCKGLIAAILFRSNKDNFSDSHFTSLIAEKCYEKGLLVVHTGRESIKIGPPLIIPDEAIIEGLEVIEQSIKEVIEA